MLRLFGAEAQQSERPRSVAGGYSGLQSKHAERQDARPCVPLNHPGSLQGTHHMPYHMPELKGTWPKEESAAATHSLCRTAVFSIGEDSSSIKLTPPWRVEMVGRRPCPTAAPTPPPPPSQPAPLPPKCCRICAPHSNTFAPGSPLAAQPQAAAARPRLSCVRVRQSTGSCGNSGGPRCSPYDARLLRHVFYFIIVQGLLVRG